MHSRYVCRGITHGHANETRSVQSHKFLYTQNSIPSNRYDYKNYSCDYDGQKMNVIYKAGTVLLFSLTSLNKITC